MIYTPMTRDAMQAAYIAHIGHRDKGGVPYIFHPIHLAEQMTDEVSCCVALLHDVVEDSTVTLEDLAKSFPPEVVDAVRLLTHEKGTDYFEYVRGIKANPIAVKVKLADLAHNADETRLDGAEGVTEEQRQRWQEKYRKAREILLG